MYNYERKLKMAFSEELRGFDISAEQRKHEKKDEAKRVIGQLLDEHIDKWASYILKAVQDDIKKKAEQGLFQLIGTDKKQIVGVAEFRGEDSGFYKNREGIRCNVHPCYKITVTPEQKEILLAGFNKFAMDKKSRACMRCSGVGVSLIDDQLWCQRLYFTKAERLFYFFKISGKPASEYVELLASKVSELGENESIKIKLQPETGSVRASYSIKY